MPTTTQSSLDDQIAKAVMTLRRRRVVQEVPGIVIVLGVEALLLILMAVTYQAPLESVTPRSQPAEPRR
ncbi:MAG TPA: hypothetical protein VL137_13030 [Polyangiaceae bacterium]|jgi:hypothetical protein|nr:hypothetical protein [Polyangiaceae bacterium]